jgi:nucleoid-associated protein YgaU
MKKLFLLIMVLFVAGCSVKTYTIEKKRVDTGISGNQGFISGTPKPEEKESNLKDTRTISVMEFDFGPKSPKGESVQEEEYVEEEYVTERVYVEEEVIEVIEEEPAVRQVEYEYYTVQKNDTLQKISQKFYGTTKKWYKLYEENKDTLKGPDKIYPGMKIRIPVL